MAIFVEGQTELIFIQDFLLRLIDPSKLSFESWKLIANDSSPVRYSYSSPSPEIHFMVINVQGDESVLSSIKEREKDLIEKGGYEKIIGLRDMYSDVYKRFSPAAINEKISKQIIDRHNLTIHEMTYRDRIKLYFAIMEIEAWFLAMCGLFERINPILTISSIKSSLGFDLTIIDPQKEFFKPSNQVKGILLLVGKNYDKKESDVKNITSKMELSDFDNAIENGRCKCFNDFYQEIRGYN